MARLIDADTLKGYLMQSTVYAWDAEQDAIAHRWVLHAIDNAPTIDAVPVVRCKNCKHFRTFHTASDGEEIRLCVGRGIVDLYYDDFCSKAERKDDE